MEAKPQRPPDKKLIEDIMAGGARRERALAWFVNDKNFRNLVVRYAFAYRKGDANDAQELFFNSAEIFSRAIGNGQFRGETGLRSFFTKTVFNEWRNMCRKKDREKATLTDYKETEFIDNPEFQTDPRETSASERALFLEMIIQKADINPRCKKMFSLRQQGYTNEEIEALAPSTNASRDFYKCHNKFRAYILSRPDILDQLK
jgi:RNA polymerase sigma factor (sigma-70 family)